MRVKNTLKNKNRINYNDKKCCQCNTIKSCNNFYFKQSNLDGLYNLCKECCKVADCARVVKNINSNINRTEYSDKKCSICKIVKSGDCFYKCNSKAYGLSSNCKDCIDEWRQERKLNIIVADGRVCVNCNAYKTSDGFWLAIHTKTGLSTECKDCYKGRAKEYAPRRREIKRNKYKNDLIFRLSSNIQSTISSSLRGRAVPSGKAERFKKHLFDYLPYTIEELKGYIESKWELWMNWDNYGRYNSGHDTWQLDHIIPQSKLRYNSMEHPNFLKCWSLDNLQPLETIANIKKGNRY